MMGSTLLARTGNGKNMCDATSSPPAAPSTPALSTGSTATTFVNDDDDDNNNNNNCALLSRSRSRNDDDHQVETDEGGDTVVMNSDDSSGSGGSAANGHHHPQHHHDHRPGDASSSASSFPDEDDRLHPHDQSRLAVMPGRHGGSWQPQVVERQVQQDDTRRETLLRIVEQEDIEVSAEVFIEDGGGEPATAGADECDASNGDIEEHRRQQIEHPFEHSNNDGASLAFSQTDDDGDQAEVVVEYAISQDQHENEEANNDECIAAADVEIEEEDLDTLARDRMPGVARAVPQQPDLRDVDLLELSESRLSVSALTTTYALDEDFKLPPAYPSQQALGQRASSGETSGSETANANDDHRQMIVHDDEGTVSAVDVAAYYYGEADHNEEQTPDTAAAAAATRRHNNDLPDFKCQSREYQEHHRESSSPVVSPAIPTRSPLSSLHVSGGTNSSSNNTTRTEDMPTEIPVAPAVLVPDEQLRQEERGGGSSSPSPSTFTTTGSGSNGRHSLPPKSERNFWMTVIVIALTLNSMLVGGIVVGGFCAAGKCSATASVVEPAPPSTDAGAMVPTPAPSRRLNSSTDLPPPTMSFVPPTTMPPVDGSPTTTGDTMPVMAPGVTENVTIAGGGTGPGMYDPLVGKSGNETTGDDDAVVDDDSVIDGSVIDDPDDAEPLQDGNSSDGAIPVRLLVLLAVLSEAVIASILFGYYRHWRRRVLASQATTKHHATMTTAAMGSENEAPGQDPEAIQASGGTC